MRRYCGTEGEPKSTTVIIQEETGRKGWTMRGERRRRESRVLLLLRGSGILIECGVRGRCESAETESDPNPWANI